MQPCLAFLIVLFVVVFGTLYFVLKYGGDEIPPQWVVHRSESQGEEMYHVEWSEEFEDGTYLFVRHYPDRHRAAMQAEEFNRDNRQPWEFMRGMHKTFKKDAVQ